MSDQSKQQFTDGAAYERLMGRWSRKIGRQFLQWCDVENDKAWLDAGCGTGAFTQEILALAKPASVVGLDPSPEQIAYAKAQLGAQGAQFHVGDSQKMPFESGMFDASVMALVVVFIPNPLQGVTELKRVTRQRGHVSAYMWDLPGGGIHLSPIYRALRDMGLEGPTPPHPEVSTLDGLRGLWNEAGMTQVSTTTLKIEVTFSSFEQFWADNTLLAGPLGHFVLKLSDEKKTDLQGRLQQILPIAGDGSISYGAFAHAVKGRA